MEKKNYITPQGMQKLKNEYHELLNGERPKLVEVVAWAASNGDRSENADYLYGKKRLREIDSRLRFLRDRIESAIVVEPTEVQSLNVVFGATVTISDENEKKFTYQIVGEDEIDIKKNKISWKSPMATALLGKKQGDEILVKKPSSEDFFTIESIQFI